MSVGLYRGAVALVGLERELEALSNNLANVGTVGFKRSRSAFQEFRVEPSPGEAGDVRGIAVRSQVDFSQGDLRRTGRDLDLALFGDGFFAVEGPSGELLTRDGSFHLTPDGVLVTEEGYALNWDKRTGTIDTAGHPLVFGPDGSLRQGEIDIGRLRIVDLEKRELLRRDARGYWIAPPRAAETVPTGTVHQYALEESNENGVEEIVALIGVQRAFEAVARVVSSIDESYRRLTRPF